MQKPAVTNFGRIFQKEQRYFPPGNGQVVYSDGKVLYDSVRAHVHRTAAAEAELLMALRAKDKEACYEIIDGVCTTVTGCYKFPCVFISCCAHKH